MIKYIMDFKIMVNDIGKVGKIILDKSFGLWFIALTLNQFKAPYIFESHQQNPTPRKDIRGLFIKQTSVSLSSHLMVRHRFGLATPLSDILFPQSAATAHIKTEQFSGRRRDSVPRRNIAQELTDV